MQWRQAVCVLVLVMGGSNVAAVAQHLIPREPVVPSAATKKQNRAEWTILPSPLSYYRRVHLRPTVALSHERTLFSRQVSLSVADIWDKRLQLGCFQWTRPTDLTFAAPASNVTLGTTPQSLLPPRDWSFGISLSFHRASRLAPPDRLPLPRCENVVTGAGLGCSPKTPAR